MPKKDIFSNPISKNKRKTDTARFNAWADNVKLTQEQDFNREIHMAQIFSHLLMSGEISMSHNTSVGDLFKILVLHFINKNLLPSLGRGSISVGGSKATIDF